MLSSMCEERGTKGKNEVFCSLIKKIIQRKETVSKLGT